MYWKYVTIRKLDSTKMQFQLDFNIMSETAFGQTWPLLMQDIWFLKEMFSHFLQVDRSPTGSGVTARVALQYHKRLILLNQTRTFQSGTTKSQFTGRAVQVIVYIPFSCVLFSVCVRLIYHMFRIISGFNN